MASRPAEVQQIDLTKLNLQQLQQLKNEFESVSIYIESNKSNVMISHLHAHTELTPGYKYAFCSHSIGAECVSRFAANTKNSQN